MFEDARWQVKSATEHRIQVRGNPLLTYIFRANMEQVVVARLDGDPTSQVNGTVDGYPSALKQV